MILTQSSYMTWRPAREKARDAHEIGNNNKVLEAPMMIDEIQ
jgi:hypothetical protein